MILIMKQNSGIVISRFYMAVSGGKTENIHKTYINRTFSKYNAQVERSLLLFELWFENSLSFLVVFPWSRLSSMDLQSSPFSSSFGSIIMIVVPRHELHC